MLGIVLGLGRAPSEPALHPHHQQCNARCTPPLMQRMSHVLAPANACQQHPRLECQQSCICAWSSLEPLCRPTAASLSSYRPSLAQGSLGAAVHAALLLLTGWTGSDFHHDSPRTAPADQPALQSMERSGTHSLGRVLVVSASCAPEVRQPAPLMHASVWLLQCCIQAFMKAIPLAEHHCQLCC